MDDLGIDDSQWNQVWNTGAREPFPEQPGSPERRAGANGAHAAERRARALGWFSLGLGLTQLAAPGYVSRAIGLAHPLRRRRGTMVSVGVRELAAGMGILTRRRPTGFLWMRVAGDLMDLALLAAAARSRFNNRRRVRTAMAAVLGVGVLDLLTSRQLGRAGSHAGERRVPITKAITVGRPPEEVYRFWRNFQNLPRFMTNLESVEVLDDRSSRWSARGPAGKTIEWEATIIEDRENERIAWCSEDAGVASEGTVTFTPAPGGRGTEVRVELSYQPPGGPVGAAAARLFGTAPARRLERDLRRLKQVLETGEVVQSDASLHRGPHPARPPEEPVTKPFERGVR